MATLKLEIVTPEEKIYSEEVDMVTLPGSEGELGVYPKHVPLLTTLKPGELRVIKSGRETTMAIGEGFVEIKGDAVSVLTDMALESEKIDIAAAEAAVERAKAAMKENVDLIAWMRVRQLNRLLKFFRAHDIHHVIMAGQIAPKNLFDLQPDWKALLLLGKLKERNAESIFAAIADELAKIDVELLPATTFLEDSLAPAGLVAGAKLSRQEEEDVDLGWKTAKEIARLNIGQTVIVKNGTLVAVEAFEGTNETIKRGGAVAREGAIMVKVAKPEQDMRFDVPVIGVETIRIAAEARVRVIAVEAGKTLLLERDAIVDLANRSGISIVARVS